MKKEIKNVGIHSLNSTSFQFRLVQFYSVLAQLRCIDC